MADSTDAAAATGAAPASHKPRSLAAEIGIVLIGVLLALFAQQAADALHWSAEVAETRQALADELSANIGAIRGNQWDRPCATAHADALEAWARGQEKDNPNRRFRSFRALNLRSTVWDVAKSSQAAGHIPLKERLAYARYYANVDNQAGVIELQRNYWRQIVAFADKSVLTPAEAARLLELISQSRNNNRFMRANEPGLIDQAVKLGAHEPKLTPSPSDCGPTAAYPPLGQDQAGS